MKRFLNISAIFIFFSLCILLLFSSNSKSQLSDKKIFTVIIDAGHGGKDPGTTGTTGIYERGIVLSIAQKLRDFLSKEYSDVKVVMTRDKDEFIELKERGNIANSEGGNLFVSIHCNAK